MYLLKYISYITCYFSYLVCAAYFNSFFVSYIAGTVYFIENDKIFFFRRSPNFPRDVLISHQIRGIFFPKWNFIILILLFLLIAFLSVSCLANLSDDSPHGWIR